jgi:hypothetical protein
MSALAGIYVAVRRKTNSSELPSSLSSLNKNTRQGKTTPKSKYSGNAETGLTENRNDAKVNDA